MQKLGDSPGLWVAGTAVAAVISGGIVAWNPAAAGLLVAPIAGFAIFAKRPQIGFFFWLLLLAVVPCWIGASAAGLFMPATLIGSLAALTCLFTGTNWRPSRADGAVVLMLAAATLGVQFGSDTGASSASAFREMFTLWIPGYLVGRFVCERAGISFVTATTTTVFGGVGLLAIAENMLSWHPFVGLTGMNTLSEIWAPIQIRGGEERSEWAFGHSIALGGSLALAIPFVLSSTLRTRNKAVIIGLILGGVATTYSRGAMIAAGLTLALSILTTQALKRTQKVLLILAATGLGIYTAIGYFTVAEAAGSEVTDSSGYRVSLFNTLLWTLAPFGRASSYRGAAGDGQTYYNNFTSIDNSFMALGLGFGWIAMIVTVIPFIVMGIRLLSRRASFAEVALLGQLPVITTVAMITQYQVFVWMVAGLAAALAATPRVSEAAPPVEFRKTVGYQ